jgi:hypothetical protein
MDNDFYDIAVGITHVDVIVVAFVVEVNFIVVVAVV